MDNLEAATNAIDWTPTAGEADISRSRSRPAHAAYTAWHRSRAGAVQLDAVADHRIRILAGGPVGGTCGKHRFVYTRGDMDIMPAGYADRWHEDADSTSLYVSLAPRLLQRTAEELGLDPQRASVEMRWQLRDSHIEHIAWALDAERRTDYRNGRLYVDSLGTALAVHLLQRYPAVPPTRSEGLAPVRLRRLKDYIEQNLDQPLSLAQLAEVAGLSASHLKTMFRRSTGLPVHQYVMRRRVEHARELLAHGDLPLSQVALDAGFAHQSHMARCMQSLLGLTPSAVRRRRPA